MLVCVCLQEPVVQQALLRSNSWSSRTIVSRMLWSSEAVFSLRAGVVFVSCVEMVACESVTYVGVRMWYPHVHEACYTTVDAQWWSVVLDPHKSRGTQAEINVCPWCLPSVFVLHWCGPIGWNSQAVCSLMRNGYKFCTPSWWWTVVNQLCTSMLGCFLWQCLVFLLKSRSMLKSKVNVFLLFCGHLQAARFVQPREGAARPRRQGLGEGPEPAEGCHFAERQAC